MMYVFLSLKYYFRFIMFCFHAESLITIRILMIRITLPNFNRPYTIDDVDCYSAGTQIIAPGYIYTNSSCLALMSVEC